MLTEIKNNNTRDLLSQFINELSENPIPSFRYFNKRNIDCIKNHIYTVVWTENNKPVAYGHLDIEGDKTWLGVCVLEKYQGMNLGKFIVSVLIDTAKRKGKDIHLSCDKENIVALNMYLKNGFFIVKKLPHAYILKYKV